ncbi:hypothetical protein GCM10027431_32540 [Lysobacter rhizosphaerae]
MSETWLTPGEVEQLTAVKRWTAQCRALARMGIPFLPNAVGRPLVERAVLLGKVVTKPARVEPNWGALRVRRQAEDSE